MSRYKDSKCIERLKQKEPFKNAIASTARAQGECWWVGCNPEADLCRLLCGSDDPRQTEKLADGKHPMLVPTLSGGHCTDMRSTSTKLHITADDGRQPPLPAALVCRGHSSFIVKEHCAVPSGLLRCPWGRRDRRSASAPIESTRRYYLARAQRCGNSSRSPRWGSHHGASNDDANDDSNALE